MSKIYERYRGRVSQLADELEKLEGFIFMGYWVDGVNDCNLEEALENPCGTAACIAGKAGLMSVFRDQGYSYDPEENAMTIDPAEFFGPDIYAAIFVGRWAMRYIHTPQQAAILLRHFLDIWTVETYMHEKWRLWWQPDNVTREAIFALSPAKKEFPVSGWGAKLTYVDGDRSWESYELKKP